MRRKSNFLRYEGNPCYTPWFDRVKAMDLIMDLDRLSYPFSVPEFENFGYSKWIMTSSIFDMFMSD